jgi:hypothetical protein
MDLKTSLARLIGGAFDFRNVLPKGAPTTDGAEGSVPRRASRTRAASWIFIGAVGLCISACQTQSGMTGTPEAASTPASTEACLGKARQEVPDTSSQSSSQVQKQRYFVYRACKGTDKAL